MKNKLSLNLFDYIMFIIFIVLLTRDSFYFLLSPLLRNIIIIVVSIYFFFRILILLFIHKKNLYLSKLLMLTLLLIIFSSAWAYDTIESFEKAILSIILPSMVMIYIINKHKLINVLISTVIAGSIIAISSFFTVYALPHFGVTSEGVYTGLWTGIFPNKNLLAVSITFHFIISLFLLSHIKRNLYKVLILILITMYLVIIVKASSTTSIMTLLITTLFPISIVYAFRIKNKYLFASITVFTLLIISTVISGILLNLNKIVNIFNKDLTFSGRTELWEIVWSLIQQRPLLGYGYGMFWNSQSYTYDYVQKSYDLFQAHNGFLDIITNIGFVGLILLISSLVIYLKNNVRLIINTKNRLFILPLMYIVFFVLYNLSESYFIEQNFFMWAFYFYFYHYLLIGKNTKLKES